MRLKRILLKIFKVIGIFCKIIGGFLLICFILYLYCFLRGVPHLLPYQDKKILEDIRGNDKKKQWCMLWIDDEFIKVRSLYNGKEFSVIKIEEGSIEDFDISRDGKNMCIVVCNKQPQLGLVNMEVEKEVFSLYLVNIEKKGKKKIFSTEEHFLSSCFFSPDGKKITFTCNTSLYVYEIEKSKVFKILNHTLLGKFSPDGSKIGYCDLAKKLFILDLKTGEKVKIAKNVRDFAWSPEGEEIVYITNPPENYCLFLVHKSQKGFVRELIVKLEGYDRRFLKVDWTPDKRYVVVLEERSPSYKILPFTHKPIIVDLKTRKKTDLFPEESCWLFWIKVFSPLPSKSKINPPPPMYNSPIVIKFSLFYKSPIEINASLFMNNWNGCQEILLSNLKIVRIYHQRI